MTLLTVILVVLFGLSTGCFQGPGIFEQNNSNTGLYLGATDADGVTTARIQSASGVTQFLTAGGENLAGTQVVFPPGALMIDLNISLEEGSDLVAGIPTSLLGGSNLSVAGNPTVIKGDTSIDATQPFTLQLPILQGFGLTSQGKGFLVVIFRVERASEGQLYEGIIPTKMLRIVDNKVSFETQYFGSYQLAYADSEIKEQREAVTETPIITKREENKLPPPSWNWKTATFHTPSSEIRLRAELSGMTAPFKCELIADQDKKAPWDHRVCGLSKPEFIENLNKDSGRDHDKNCMGVLDGDEHKSDNDEKLYARFVCSDSLGRTATSPWSQQFTVPNLKDSSHNNHHPYQHLAPVYSTPSFVSYNMVSIPFTIPSDPLIRQAFIVWNNSATIPEDCNTSRYPGHMFINATSLHPSPALGNQLQGKFDIYGLNPLASFSYRVCTELTEAAQTSHRAIPGFTDTLQLSSTPSYALCDNTNGNLSSVTSTCDFTSTRNITDFQRTITGRGHLNINTDINVSDADPLRIYIDGDITFASSVSITGNLDIRARNITLKDYAKLDANGRGFPGRSGPQAGGGENAAAGGGNSNPAIFSPGMDYAFPNIMGGGGVGTSPGTPGGGVIHLQAEEDLSFNSGTKITANGSLSSGSSGAGAGGSIWIKAKDLNITSSDIIFEAKGGSNSSYGNAGAGGRIAIHYETTTLNPAQTMLDRASVDSGNTGTVGSGLIFIRRLGLISEPPIVSELYVGPFSSPGSTSTPTKTIVDLSQENHLNHLHIRDGARVQLVYAHTPVHPFTQRTVIHKITISPKGAIDHSGMVATSNSNQKNSNPDGYGAGGSNGGRGGEPASGAEASPSKSINDFSVPPQTGGSAGGPGNNATELGGEGGGLIILQADKIYNHGHILADGGGLFASKGGGGAGGTIYLQAHTEFEMTDSSKISAKGGDNGGGGGWIILKSNGNMTIGGEAEITVSGGDGNESSETMTGGFGGQVYIASPNLNFSGHSSILADGGHSTYSSLQGADGGKIYFNAQNSFSSATMIKFSAVGGDVQSDGVGGNGGEIYFNLSGSYPNPLGTFDADKGCFIFGGYGLPDGDNGSIYLNNSMATNFCERGL